MYIHKHTLGKVEFEWSELKNMLNYDKHGVWFAEAETVWNDPLPIERFDIDHSDDEDRFVRCGHSGDNRLLVVAYSERNNGNLIRVISARLATLKERCRYEEGV